jgi:hypothetical protein
MSAKIKPTTNVVAINPQGDAALADERHASERCLILDGIDEADKLAGDALIEGLRMTVTLGKTSTDEVAKHYTRCNNPAVYSSWFNLGHRAQEVIGQKRTLETIAGAIGAGKGSAFQRAREALQAVLRTAKTQGVKTLDGRAAQNVVKEAVKSATSAAEERKAVKSAVVRGVKVQDAATMARAALECGKGHREMAAFLLLCSQNAHRLPEPVGREDLHRKAIKALADCAELWQGFKA